MVYYKLGTTDYVVICCSLLISAGIGIVLRFYGGKQKSVTDYLFAGKNMSKTPVILSIIVTMTSPVSLMGSPAEIYRYGLQAILFNIFIAIGVILAAHVFIPVYYQCGVSTVNEFLEMRFGIYTRTIVSIMLSLQMLVYMSAALYGSVLALSAVTDIPVEVSIVSLGVICAFYCSIGGLKAVLWTDSYQAILIFICIIAIFAVGIPDGGGFYKIYERLYEGNRLNIFDFQISFFKRYTVWNTLSRGFFYGFACYGTSQIEVQRILSLKNAKEAKSTLLFSTLPVTVTYFLCASFGAILYSVFYLCDPILNKQETGISKYDQLLPYYIVKRFSSIPGMTGLCIAGIFSASLSTVSSALNSLSTVTVMDFIKPVMEKTGTISEMKLVYLAKGLSILYGGICIGLSFSFLKLTSLMQMSNSVLISGEGTMLAIFLFGVLTRKMSDKAAAPCLLIGFIFTSWISMGSLYSGYYEMPLPLSTSMCNTSLQNSSHFISLEKDCNGTVDCLLTTILPFAYEKEPFVLYKTSYMWHSFFGFTLTVTLAIISIFLTGWRKNVIPADSKCLSPVSRLWIKNCNKELKDKGERTNYICTKTTQM